MQYLILGSKARALLQGRTHVTCEDIEILASSKADILVGFAPLFPAEFVVIQIQQIAAQAQS